MFIDQAVITVKAGDGGNGCCSFLREKFRPKGGPDGGDGGRGGDVRLIASEDTDTLLDFLGRAVIEAERGGHGMGKNMTGKSGADLLLKVPPGTLIYDAERGNLLADLDRHGAEVVIARGGRGGLGNQHFAGPAHQTPREHTPGRPGELRRLRLELKLLADVGIVGRPNAGKSSLLARMSRARPKVADYPFTTVTPVLGIVELPGDRRLVMADIPGLIEGAHRGVGLGDAFLRHIERTRVLVHLLEVMPVGEPAPVEAYRQIREELSQYSPELAAKPEIVVVNKMDLTDADDAADRLERDLGRPVLRVSAATGRGIGELAEHLWKELHPPTEDRLDAAGSAGQAAAVGGGAGRASRFARVPPHKA
jgi:GTP-binding protein